MKRTRKLAVAGISMVLILVIVSAGLLHHEKVSAQDEEPYSVSLNSPLTFPVDI